MQAFCPATRRDRAGTPLFSRPCPDPDRPFGPDEVLSGPGTGRSPPLLGQNAPSQGELFQIASVAGRLNAPGGGDLLIHAGSVFVASWMSHGTSRPCWCHILRPYCEPSVPGTAGKQGSTATMARGVHPTAGWGHGTAGIPFTGSVTCVRHLTDP